MGKSTLYVIIAVIGVNLLFFGIEAKVVWDYHRNLDPDGPTLSHNAGIRNPKFFETRLRDDDELLKVVHYWILPVAALSNLLSAYTLFWLLRKRSLSNFADGGSIQRKS